MDFEKKYNEALERANKQRADYQKELDKTDKNSQLAGLLRAGISAIDMAFPELRESEDERIRRTLVEYFGPKVQLDFVRGIPIQKIRDWLDKQKEQKEELVYRLNGLMQDYIKEGKDDEEKEHRLKCYQLFWDALEDTNFFEQKEQKQTDLPAGFYYIDLNGNRYYSKEFRYGDMKLKVGEQKPAECLKAERDGWYVCIKDFYAGGKKQCSIGELVQAKGGMYMMGKEDISEWFRRAYYEEVRDAFGPNTDTNIPEQKPVEKQDYSGLNDLERAILRGFLCAGVENVPIGIIKDTAAECIVFLALIEPTWSEEDEKIRNLAIEWAETMDGQFRFVDMGSTDFRKIVAWLKSLRPDTFQNGNSRPKTSDNWKPSEEHLSALLAVFNDPNNIGSQTCQLALTDLYEQLKKL